MAESHVYRVTREKQQICYTKNCKHEVTDNQYNMGWVAREPRYYHWVRSVRICSKRSAMMQVAGLVRADGSQKHPRERLISVERSPFDLFENCTQEAVDHVATYLR